VDLLHHAVDPDVDANAESESESDSADALAVSDASAADYDGRRLVCLFSNNIERLLMKNLSSLRLLFWIVSISAIAVIVARPWGDGEKPDLLPLTPVVIPESLPPPPPPAASAVLPEVDPALQYQYYLDACCRVYSGNSGGSGTCFRVDDQYVYLLTCRHVAGGNKTAQIEFWRDGHLTKRYPARLLKTFKVDAAVLVVDRSLFGDADSENRPPRAIPVATEGPQPGDTIISVGCPGLGWQTLFEGHVVGAAKMGNYNGAAESFTFVPPPKGGRSGSGIFKDGKIVGILWGSDNKSGKGSGGKGYAVKCEDLKGLDDLVAPPDKPGGLFFTASWCRFCDEMKPIIEGLRAKGIEIREIDYDLNTTFAEMYEIGSLPAFVNQGGDTISGVRSEEELREFFCPPSGE
jgi:thiol-disulfide isomerase/thioredoxin